MTLQKLLLLLGYISHTGSLGSAPLTAADQAALAADLVAPLATALRSAASALWLCKTPASTPVSGLLAGLRTNTGEGTGEGAGVWCLRVWARGGYWGQWRQQSEDVVCTGGQY